MIESRAGSHMNSQLSRNEPTTAGTQLLFAGKLKHLLLRLPSFPAIPTFHTPPAETHYLLSRRRAYHLSQLPLSSRSTNGTCPTPRLLVHPKAPYHLKLTPYHGADPTNKTSRHIATPLTKHTTLAECLLIEWHAQARILPPTPRRHPPPAESPRPPATGRVLGTLVSALASLLRRAAVACSRAWSTRHKM